MSQTRPLTTVYSDLVPSAQGGCGVSIDTRDLVYYCDNKMPRLTALQGCLHSTHHDLSVTVGYPSVYRAHVVDPMLGRGEGGL